MCKRREPKAEPASTSFPGGLRHCAEADADYLADALLAPLAAGLFTLQRHDEHASLTRLKTGIDTLVRGVASTTPPSGYVPRSGATR